MTFVEAIRPRAWSAAVLFTLMSCTSAQMDRGGEAPRFNVERHDLANGLRVVLCRDASLPLAFVGVYYAVGPRHEPEGRGGFAHLFEHFMFEGSPSLGPREFFELVTSNGGRFGARTLYDVTKYTNSIPKNALELVLWAEADRMRGLRADPERLANVKEVVKNEVRQQTVNRPYGRFVWIDVPEVAQTKWVNSHSIYGDSLDGSMKSIDAATVEEARQFFDSYYGPNNAVLVVYGNFDPRVTLRWIERDFGVIPRRPRGPQLDSSEPRQEAEKRATRHDPNASRPAVALSYHMPPRSSPDFWVMQVINQILVEGRDSWMYAPLVKAGLTDGVYGGVSARHGSIYTTAGPNFWSVYAYHDRQTPPETIVAAMDAQIERIRNTLIDENTLRRAITKARADFVAQLRADQGGGVADMLGQFTLFDDDPQRINSMPEIYRAMTPRTIQKVAQECLRRGNRTVLMLTAKEAK